MANRHVKRIAITMGDPAGVGPELCLKALQDEAVRRTSLPVVVGDAAILERVASACHLPLSNAVVSLSDWERGVTFPGGESWIARASGQKRSSLARFARPAAGRPSGTWNGPFNGLLMVRWRVSPQPPSTRRPGAWPGSLPGHTEALAHATHADGSCMMLHAEDIACSFVTTHIAVKDVPGRIILDRVLDVLDLTHQAMMRLRGHACRLVVCGLNPHAGEHGLFGREEIGRPGACRAQGEASGSTG